MKYFKGRGEHVAKFAEHYIVQTKGRWAGGPLLLERWEQDWLDELLLCDSAGGLVYREALLGVARKNGKSTIGAAVALYMLLFGDEGAEVYSAAASRDQARVVFDQARKFVESSPRLLDFLKPMRNSIVRRDGGGHYQVLAADGKLQHGLNPSLVVIDELHAFMAPGQVELFHALTTAQGARENPLVVSITTAGYDRTSICYQQYERGIELEREGVGAMRDARFFFRWFGGGQGTAVDDREVWRAANPSSWINFDDLERQLPPGRPENVFRRLYLNEWTSADKAWLPVGAWDGCYDPEARIPDGAQIWVGVDIGLKKDTSAVTRVWRRDDGKVVAETTVLEPAGDGRPVELSAVEAEIRRVAGKYSLMGCAYDQWAFQRSSEILSSEGIYMLKVQQTDTNMVPATGRLYDAICEGRVVHDGDTVLGAHVEAGALKDSPRGSRLVKQPTGKPIDALVALAMAFGEVDVEPQSFKMAWV